jgi:Invasion associated locus B (IalB) protein
MAMLRDPLPRGVRPRIRYPVGMTGYRLARLGLLLLMLALIPVASAAANPKKPDEGTPPTATAPSEELGVAESWTAYSYKEKSGKVCYLAGAPQKRDPAAAKRKPSRAMVTHRPGEKIANVVSFVEGSPLKEGSEVSLDIGGAKFDLFTKGDSAWARTPELDKSIVETMAKGKQATVKATPRKGPPTTDTYSLAGFAQALALIDKACDVKR